MRGRAAVRRAACAVTRFGLTAENQADVAELCRRLNGIPLALELAAVRIDSMTPAEIVHPLEHRFQLLGVDPSMRGATRRCEAPSTGRIGSSTNEQTLFARLSVFAGGWAIAARDL